MCLYDSERDGWQPGESMHKGYWYGRAIDRNGRVSFDFVAPTFGVTRATTDPAESSPASAPWRTPHRRGPPR